MRLTPTRRQRTRESGTELMVFLFTFPLICILLLGMISVGMYFSTRSAVTSVARDAVSGFAAYGEDCPDPDVIPGPAKCFSQQAEQRLWDGGGCTQGPCTGQPTVTCSTENGAAVATYVGEIVTCVVDYPYAGVNKSLLDSPIGLGLGGLIDEYVIEVSAVAEIGTDGTVGIQ